MKYDYLQAVTDDVKQYIENEIDIETYGDDIEEKLHDELWVVDSVTGNASGSYTFNTWKAEENLCHNMELLWEACDAFGCDLGYAVKQGAEYCDVTIRCYVLSQAISDALEEFIQEE